MNSDLCFIEVDSFQAGKHGQPVSGDAFLSRKVKDTDRIIAVLADGLGSGIKASVLATLTGSMALKFVAVKTDIRNTATIIMDVLPVCSQRKIGYSTFTILDIGAAGDTRIIEHDNPPFLAIRGGERLDVPKTAIELPPDEELAADRNLSFSQLRCKVGDRLICFSDGVNQSGMGRGDMPLGWGLEAVEEYACKLIAADFRISARELARKLVRQAVRNDRDAPKDDITCAVIYFRRPRRLLVVTGPPFSKRNDALLAQTLVEFQGRKVICGGTTAKIVGRELRKEITVDLSDIRSDIPPRSTMQGVDLITEGTITLARVAEMLEHDIAPENVAADSAAAQLVELLLDSDIVEFMVGTRINEAHQDPNVPVELDIRRNVVKKIRALLEDRHLKETDLELI